LLVYNKKRHEVKS